MARHCDCRAQFRLWIFSYTTWARSSKKCVSRVMIARRERIPPTLNDRPPVKISSLRDAPSGGLTRVGLGFRPDPNIAKDISCAISIKVVPKDISKGDHTCLE